MVLLVYIEDLLFLLLVFLLIELSILEVMMLVKNSFGEMINNKEQLHFWLNLLLLKLLLHQVKH